MAIKLHLSDFLFVVFDGAGLFFVFVDLWLFYDFHDGFLWANRQFHDAIDVGFLVGAVEADDEDEIQDGLKAVFRLPFGDVYKV